MTATSKHSLDSVRCHHVRSLDPSNATAVDGIPATTIPASSSTLPRPSIPSVCAARWKPSSARTSSTSPPSPPRSPAAESSRHKTLIAALNQLRDEAPWTQSELERAFLELIREAGLPEPPCNVMVDGLNVDFYWPQHNLIVEVDGYRFHKTRRSVEDDRRRDTIHTVAGRRVLRITHQRIVHGRAALIRDLARMLSR